MRSILLGATTCILIWAPHAEAEAAPAGKGAVGRGGVRRAIANVHLRSLSRTMSRVRRRVQTWERKGSPGYSDRKHQPRSLRRVFKAVHRAGKRLARKASRRSLDAASPEVRSTFLKGFRSTQDSLITLNGKQAINTNALYLFEAGRWGEGGIRGMNIFAGKTGQRHLSLKLKERRYLTRWESGLAEDDFDIVNIPIYQMKLQFNPWAKKGGTSQASKSTP
jgi:hypothetical protein